MYSSRSVKEQILFGEILFNVMDYIRYSFQRKVSYCVVTICVYIKLNSVQSLDFYHFPFVFIRDIHFKPSLLFYQVDQQFTILSLSSKRQETVFLFHGICPECQSGIKCYCSVFVSPHIAPCTFLKQSSIFRLKLIRAEVTFSLYMLIRTLVSFTQFMFRELYGLKLEINLDLIKFYLKI